ncbi:PAS domain-containing sensor histidine kinase [Terriglobus roseus]|uniref:histidine kinase n=1 Tax=Terriglobus roseus TaxID=392734 RepID=A0A1H4J775_9BACT|nr:PAS domain-containing sensor histidine kinase [Terriglobus roseus]SEB42164.1 PAS domain S-box-containing protein [Terriglobus roseus]
MAQQMEHLRSSLPKQAGTWSDPERWLAAIVESSNSAIMAESLEGTIMTWNAAASRIFGYTAEEAIGMPVFALAWPGEESIVRGLLDVLRRGERIDNFETSRRHKDGHRVFIALSLFPIKDEDDVVIGIAKIATDITQRKAAEAAEAQTRTELLAERKYREVIEHAPDAILEVDAGGIIVIANQTAERHFGYPREELLGAPIEMLIPAANRSQHASHRDAFMQADRARAMGEGLDLSARRKDGSEFPVEVSLSPIVMDSGVLVVAAIRDVTERRRSDQQVRLLQESYLSEVSARQQEAERLNRLKSEFLASVSHELRTPLHTIIGFTDLLHEDPQHTLSERQLRFVENIRRDSEHLLELINDVLDLSRIEAGGLTIHPEELSLHQAFTEAIETVRLSCEAKALRVTVSCDPDLVLLADPTRLRQILTNLLSNAIKFTAPGGAIRMKATREPGFAKISIRDNGIGIAPEELSNIFGKFYQVGVTTGGVREGTGLGLAICRELVETQGGSLSVSSQLGTGSIFSFTMPLP